MNWVKLFLACLFAGFNFAAQAQVLTATDLDNDAYVDINWTIPASCLSTPSGAAYRNGVFVEILADGEVIYSESIRQNIPKADTSSFRHFAGPDSSAVYSIRLYEIGPGRLINACSGASDSGSTLPFQPPTQMQASEDQAGQIRLSWFNNSRLSSRFLIFRNDGSGEKLIATLAGSSDSEQITFSDIFRFGDTASLLNGVVYTYCVRTYNERIDSIFTGPCDQGGTYDIGFTASDQAFADQVVLQWNDVRNLADRLLIKRNGNLLAELIDPSIRSYVDKSPIYGLDARYSVELVRGISSYIEDVDNGGVAPIGRISGFVRNEEGQGIAGATVRYRAEIFDVIHEDSVLTDYTGAYVFDELYFGTESNFLLSARLADSVVTPDTIRLLVNNQNSKINRVNFTVKAPFKKSTRPLTISGFQGVPDTDLVNFDWHFESQAELTFFQLYREGRLIAIWDNSLADTAALEVLLQDRSGEPGFFYKYELRAYALYSDSVATATARDTVRFPQVSPPFDLAISDNFDSNSMGILTLSWDHSSTNFDGFRVYRETTPIAQLDSAGRFHYDFTGQPGESYAYGVTAFRRINGRLYESELVRLPAEEYPGLFAPQSVSATPLAQANAVDVSWTVPAGQGGDDNYTGFRVYRDEQPIGEVWRGKGFTFRDLFGVPGTDYLYSVRTFVDRLDTMYTSAATAAPASVSFPAIATPPALTLAPGPGKVAVSWASSYNAQNDNFDGFLLSAGSGVDTLSRGATEWAFYSSSSANLPIQLRAFRRLGGQLYLSAPSSGQAAPQQAANQLEPITGLSATSNIPMHVVLRWTYPVFKLSYFIISRDGVPIDTLAPTARAYYDYTAQVGVWHEYYITAVFGNQRSNPAGVRGRRRNLGSVSGQVLAAKNGRNSDSLLVKLMAGSTVLDQTFTGSGGYFSFQQLPPVAQQQNMRVVLNPMFRPLEVADTAVTISPLPLVNRELTFNYVDTLVRQAFPPDPHADSIASVIGMEVRSLRNQQANIISWTMNSGRYDGVEVYRDLTRLAILEFGDPLRVVDSTGVEGIENTYFVRPFINDRLEGQKFTDNFGETLRIYPQLPPVENLTAIPSYSGEDNSVSINWSHPTGDLDFYQIERNEEVLEILQPGGVLSWEDLDGKPGQRHTYTIRPGKIQQQELRYGQPRSVTITYPEVAHPVYQAQVAPDSNGVQLNWSYKGDNVDGFRILRDNQLIAQLEKTSTQYMDVEGFPGDTHRYNVVAVLNRGGMLFQSVGADTALVFPPLAPVVNLTAAANTNLGLIELYWDYPARGVDSFEVIYTLVNPPVTRIFSVPADTLVNGRLFAEDRFALPNTTVSYRVRAISLKETEEGDERRFTSNTRTVTATFPNPPAPLNLRASDGTFENYVEITWTLDFAANVDRFEIFRNGTKIGEVGSGQRRFLDVFNDIGNNAGQVHAYGVRSVNDAFGNPYFSSMPTDNGWAGLNREVLNSVAPAAASNPGDQYGFSVAISGNNAAVGAPQHQGNGRVSFFTRSGSDWNFTKDYYYGGSGDQIGYDVDVVDDVAMIGTPGAGGNTDVGRVVFATNAFNNQALSLRTIDNDVHFERFGQSVAMSRSSTDVFFGSVSGFNNNLDGRLWQIKRNGANWNTIQTFGASRDEQGVVAAGGAFVAYGVTNAVRVYRRTNTDVLDQNPQVINSESPGIGFGSALAIGGEYLAVGAPDRGAGAVYVYRFDGDNFRLAQVLEQPNLPNNSSDDRFGASVSLNGNQLIVGAPDHFGILSGRTGSRDGLIFIFRRVGDKFEYVDYADPPDQPGNGGIARNFGQAVDIGTSHFIVGDPGVDNVGRAYIYQNDLIEVWSQKLRSVRASDGSINNQTKIEWNFVGNPEFIDGFYIYRDSVRIARTDSYQSFYFDGEGVPGRVYVYKVTAFVGKSESIGKSDRGFRPGIGVLEGSVITATGGSAVPGTRIEARAVVDGELYVYETTTDQNGLFSFNQAYFGTSVATYTLTASLEGHIYLTNPLTASIGPNNSTRSNLTFFDRTAYIISGVVRQAGVSCGIDSVRVRVVNVFERGRNVVQETFTDKEGKYTIVLKPSEPGLREMRLEIDSFHLKRNLNLQKASSQPDTIVHRFMAKGDPLVYRDFANLDQELRVDFFDTLRYPVELFVTNVCGTAAATAEFDIEVSTIDGCYQEIFKTATNGRVLARLPALDGLMITVKGVAPLRASNVLIVDYLRYRPNQLDLKAVHIEHYRKRFNSEQLAAKVNQRLVYHRTPTITLISGINQFVCGRPNEPGLLNQGLTYNFRFEVLEEHNGNRCRVDEGYLVVNNPAARTGSGNRDTLRLDAKTLQFGLHRFVAGEPNLVSPFRRGISAKYYSANNDYLGELIIPVVITGETNLPGSDIIVDPKDETGAVKLPITILRDPPGDGSFSTLEEGTVISKSYTVKTDFSLGVGIKSEFEGAIFKTGAFFDLSLKGGGGFSDVDSWSMESKTTQTISTSSAPDFVGADADVIVGMGIATQYGITENLAYQQSGCATGSPFVKSKAFGITLNEIKTDWLYTVGQIKQLISEKRAQVAAARKGTFRLTLNRRELPTAETIRRLQVEIANWEAILRYHAHESVPHIMFCSEDYEVSELSNRISRAQRDGTIQALGEDLTLFLQFTFPERVNKAREAQRDFCNRIGIYTAQDSFQLTTDPVIWTNNLASSYETAVASVSYYLDSLHLSMGQVRSRINSFRTGGGNSFLPEVENTTFSAGVEISKSSSISTSTSSNYESFGFVDFDFAGGFLFKSKTSVGIGKETSIEENELKIGPQISINWRIGEDRYSGITRESTISYTLSDDDLGDQFSVTAIRGRQSGHSPYFQLLGGRASCPPELGALLRDRLDIGVYNPNTKSTVKVERLENLPPERPATFLLQLTNLNPFGEARDFQVYFDGLSNPNQAVLELAGTGLAGSEKSGSALFTRVPANQPVILPLTLTPAVGRFQYENIKIIISPVCVDGRRVQGDEYSVSDTVTISAIFAAPCSGVTIAAPGDGWIVRRRNPLNVNSREQLLLELRDYDPFNANLQRIDLQLRRTGSFDNFQQGWITLPVTELDPPFQITNEVLKNQELPPGQLRKFFVVWDITDLYDEYPDGTYEIRAVSQCGIRGEVYSNIVQGQIVRTTGGLFAITEPGDGVWQNGDEISIMVDRTLDCGKLKSMKFEVNDLSDGGAPVPGRVGCFSDKLIFLPANMIPFDEHNLRVTATELIDGFGNIYTDTFRWDFRVIARDLYASETSLFAEMFQGAKATLSTELFSSTGVSLNYVVDNPSAYPWLKVVPASGKVPGNEGVTLQFQVDAKTLPVGDVDAYIVVRPTNAVIATPTTIHLRIRVSALPPYWVVDPSAFPSNMIVSANYQYTDPGSEPSIDSMDIVSVWIDEEIRGVGRIGTADKVNYAASLLVFGDSKDNGKTMEFRVWDASEGREYNAYPQAGQTYVFQSNQSLGSLVDPEILLVNKNRDLARYIPLNGNGSWTWFSVNSQETNMSVNRVLRSLKTARGSDVIKTTTRSASFLPGAGWISTNRLDTIRPEEGYLIYLQGPADTIRLTGVNARFKPIPIIAGYNLIGYPLQDSLPINTALNILGATEGDNIRTVAQNPARYSANMFAQYIGGSWLASGQAMERMRPTFAYLIQASAPGVLRYPGASASSLVAGDEGDQAMAQAVGFRELESVDPDRPETWAVNPAEFPQNMVVSAVLEIDGQISTDTMDRIAAFVNGECRGVTRLHYLPTLGKYIATLFVYGHQSGEEVEIRLYQSGRRRLLFNDQYLSFRSNALVGSFLQPHVFRNKRFKAQFEVRDVRCAEEKQGSIQVEAVEGLGEPYRYRWNTGQEGPELDSLGAGRYWVTITGNRGQWFVDTVELRNQAQPLPADFEAWPDSLVGLGDSVWFRPLEIRADARYEWNFGDGQSSRSTMAGHRYSQPGRYSVSLTITDTQGCQTTEVRPAWLEVGQLSPTEGVALDGWGLEATPNPFSNRLRAAITAPQGGNCRLALLDLQGKILWTQERDLAAGRQEEELDLSDLRLPDGIYFLQLTHSSNQTIILKLVKARP